MAIDKKYGKDSNQVRLNINSVLKYNFLNDQLCVDSQLQLSLGL